MGALRPLQIWLHQLGICKISKTDMVITSELSGDNITKMIHEKSTHAIGREREQRMIGM
jgi:hypothetical protein